jgi:purine nucleosidase
MQQHHLIIDCDPGHDDFAMLLLALGSPNVVVRAIVCVHGNQSVEKTTRNALQALDLARVKGIPVLQGRGSPISGGNGAECAEVHGASGLDLHGVVLPEPSQQPTACDNFLLFLRNLILDASEPTTIIGTGAMSNIAVLLLAFPEVRPRITGIHLMGGAIGAGNMSPDAEWNIMVDAPAAQLVFQAGLEVPVFLVTLEVTHQNLVTKERLEQIAAACGSNRRLAEVLHALMTFFQGTYAREFNMPDPPLHDPLALATVLAPELFSFKKRRVDVETSASSLCVGRTSVDLFGRSKKPANVFVADTCDIPAFWRLFCAAIANIAERTN